MARYYVQRTNLNNGDPRFEWLSKVPTLNDDATLSDVSWTHVVAARHAFQSRVEADEVSSWIAHSVVERDGEDEPEVQDVSELAEAMAAETRKRAAEARRPRPAAPSVKEN